MAVPEPERRGDVGIFPLLATLLECIEAELTASGLDVPGHMAVEPGAVSLSFVGEDGDCGGQGWVRVVDIYPSTQFPSEDENSKGGLLAYALEAGISRCYPDTVEGVDPEVKFEITDGVLADMAAILRAICACLKEAKRDYAIGHWTPMGPEGLAAGGNWSFIVKK